MLKAGVTTLALALAACSTAPHQQIAHPELVRAIIIASILQSQHSVAPQPALNCYSTGAGAGVIATCQ